MFRTSLLLLAYLGITACGSQAPGATAAADVKPAEECVAYASELRACFAGSGAPTQSADELAASVVAPRDEETRVEMNLACARSRIQLRGACK